MMASGPGTPGGLASRDWPGNPPGPAWLFCPGGRPDRFPKAVSVSDMAILDLEDAVAEPQKDLARSNIRDFLDRTGTRGRMVRVNAASSRHFEPDRAVLAGLPDLVVVLPMAASPAEVARLAPHRVVALCETARGVMSAREIAKAGNCIGLMLGTADLAADLGLRGTATRGLCALIGHARSQLVLAAAAAGVACVDTAYLNLGDHGEEGLAREAAIAAQMGMHAKACIHPRQVGTVRRAFAPSADDVEWARAVLAHARTAGTGAASVDGQMIDQPVIEQARSVLRRLAALQAS
jgi:citrate lyase subunit beta/citryl-CoA lyase